MLNKIEIVFCFLFFYLFPSLINFKIVGYNKLKINTQVDWKEKLKLHDVNNNEYIVSIFLMVLGNSRYKYIELTFDQTQPTLFK